MSILDNIRFWAQVVQDARRTLVVSPELEAPVVELVEAYGLAHLVTVKTSEHLLDGNAYLVDEQAIQAELERPLRIWLPPYLPPTHHGRTV